MTSFADPAFFGEQWAADYDERTERDPSAEVGFLAGLTGPGPVLELAIGTGRVGLPLAARGVRVEGIEASAAMVERMRAKPGGSDIPVVVGDMADVGVEGPYAMAYLVFNTLFNLTTQQRQVDCFAGVARVLAPGGLFVVEAFVPDTERWVEGQRLDVYEVTEHSVLLSLSRHDRAAQRLTYQRVTLDAGGLHLRPLLLRYAWPSELDLMARLAGLRLRERYSSFHRRPFEATSTSHVSVYEKP